GFVIQTAEEEDVRPADELELLGEAAQRAQVEPSVSDVVILVEAGQLGRILAGEGGGANPREPLGIDEGADGLLEAPRIRRMPRLGLGFRDVAQQGQRALDLLFEAFEDVAFRYQLDIRLEGGCILVRLRPGRYRVRHVDLSQERRIQRFSGPDGRKAWPIVP